MTALYVIVHPGSPLLDAMPKDALCLPGSVPAAIVLGESGVTPIRLSDFLAPGDFHRIWETVIPAVWRAIEADAALPTAGQPRLMPIFGYSLAIAMAQLMAVGELLDRVHARHRLTRIETDPPFASPEDVHIHGSGLGNPLYTAAALAWAEANGIACSQAPAVGPIAIVPSQPSARATWRRWASRLRQGLRAQRQAYPAQFATALIALAGRTRMVLFTNGASLPEPPVPGVAVVRIGRLPAWPRPRQSARAAFDAFAASPHWADLMRLVAPFDRFLADRVRRRLDALWGRGVPAYRYAGWLARIVRRMGATAVLLANAPFSDVGGDEIGFFAEGFRQSGGRIAEYQHGANYNMVERGFTATILTAGLGDLFLEWNDVGRREHETYGLRPPRLAFATVGCSTTDRALPFAPRASRSGECLRVLYAPSLLSSVTVCGINILWDDYIGLLDRVLEVLDRAPLEVDVSVVPHEEMRDYLARRSYPNLRFHPLAFRRLAPQADVLIADGLLGSPLHEATVTDKPAIVFTGGDYARFDARYLADVRRRCVVYENAEAYVEGIAAFAVDPAGFLARNQRAVDPALMLRYFAPTDPARFWQALSRLAAPA